MVKHKSKHQFVKMRYSAIERKREQREARGYETDCFEKQQKSFSAMTGTLERPSEVSHLVPALANDNDFARDESCQLAASSHQFPSLCFPDLLRVCRSKSFPDQTCLAFFPDLLRMCPVLALLSDLGRASRVRATQVVAAGALCADVQKIVYERRRRAAIHKTTACMLWYLRAAPGVERGQGEHVEI